MGLAVGDVSGGDDCDFWLVSGDGDKREKKLGSVVYFSVIRATWIVAAAGLTTTFWNGIWCKSDSVRKVLSENLYQSGKSTEGLLADRRWCRNCYNEKERAAWKKHPEYHARLERRYGISETQYEYIKLAQHGKCLICDSSPERLVVDHDHSTGEVRATDLSFM